MITKHDRTGVPASPACKMRSFPKVCTNASTGHAVLMRHQFVFWSVETLNINFQVSETQYKEPVSVTNILQ